MSGNEIGQAMGGMMQALGKIMGVVIETSQQAGLSQAEMEAIKQKASSGTPLSDAERAKVQRFGELLTPALEQIGPELGDAGAQMIGQIRGQFAQLLEQR